MRWMLILFITGLFLTSFTVYAAEGVISPIPEPYGTTPDTKPSVTFGELSSAIPDTDPLLTPEAIPTPTPEPKKRPVVEPTPRSSKKPSITIALLGDSMMDTMGPTAAGLAAKLNTVYPRATFTVINHGVGAENIDSGLRRLTNGYRYLGSDRNSVVSEHPDVVVVESFGYNPYPMPDIHDALTTHWLRLAAIVDTIRQQLPGTKIVIAATIAPNWDLFGDGAPGLSFSPEGKHTKVAEIKRYIESTIAFAKSQNLPLADAYHPTLDRNGNGIPAYINGGDHIHYSDKGRAFMAQTIADTLIRNRLLE